MKYLLLSLICLFGISAQAYQFGILGGMNMDSQSSSVGTTSSGTGYQGGIFLSQHFAPLLSLDVGLNYQTLQSKIALGISGQSVTLTYKSTRLQVPVILRCSFAPFLNFGLGGYYAMGIGNFEIDSSNQAIVANSTGSYDSQGVKKTDYGALGSLQLNFPIGTSTHFIIDGRYLLGLAELSSNPSQSSIKNREIDVLAGFGFGF